MRCWPLFVCTGMWAFLPLAPPAQAQNGTGIFMGQDMVLRAGPHRQLSLNANVAQYLYQPTGDNIAYVSVRDDDNSETTAIKYVGTRHPNPGTQTLFSVTGDLPNATTASAQIHSVDLLGWSRNGCYLVFREESFPGDNTQFFLGDTGTDPFQVKVRQIPALSIPDNTPGVSGAAWSPSQDSLLVYKMSFGKALMTWAGVYDPIRDQMQTLSIPDGFRLLGWQDETHLLLRQADQPVAKADYESYDLTTDKATPATPALPWPPVPQSKALLGASVPATTPKAPGMTLEADRQAVSDPQGAAHTPVWTIWLRRAAAPKAMSALSVGIAPGDDALQSLGTDGSNPQPQWSPDGDAVAYLSHGDLFQTTLEESDATPYEKVAAGEKLSCDEEKQLIMSNLKQVGLSIMQYTQDFDEHFPSATGWQDAIGPYLPNQDVLHFPGVPITYYAPPGITMASVDSPATEPLATADTPCAHIVLYADGHVKAFDKPGN